MKYFFQVQNQDLTYDMRGLNGSNPDHWLWDTLPHAKPHVYYPVKELPPDKIPMFENDMARSVGMMATCNSCDRIMYEGETWHEGGYCDDCYTDTEAPMDKRIKKAINKGQEAFWQLMLNEFPEVRTGDMPPEAEMAFDTAMKDALRTWLQFNFPNYKPDKV